jgi:hypothetical protein
MAKHKVSKTVRILDILEQAGQIGMRFSDIQEELWRMTYGDQPVTDTFRGYWCTNLLGGPYYHRGILHFFAVKSSSGLWVRNKVPHQGHPWKVMNDVARQRRGTPYHFPWG